MYCPLHEIGVGGCQAGQLSEQLHRAHRGSHTAALRRPNCCSMFVSRWIVYSFWKWGDGVGEQEMCVCVCVAVVVVVISAVVWCGAGR